MIDISDHALVRYIERIKGESLNKYRDEIRTLLKEHWGKPIPDSGYDDGILFVLEILRERPTVVTVLTPAYRPKRKNRPWSTRTLVHVSRLDEGRAA
ncbi:hypothetical protein LCGC14_1089410 [marine sediment metagenome]|uniref:Uncharacterized protein n=1 Tax=marine sediment metagenome TaxID=412755 RepID=A0A0F9MH89_9ZZZZ